MEKLKMHSMDILNDNVKKLGELFPECLTEVINDDGELEKAIDFDKLKSLFSSAAIEDNKERYQFTWPDKSKARALANQPINATLRPCREESVNFDTTENLYIEGDNLDVLKLLRETYYGKVKMIYIDPPYNTGNDFVYEDDFSQDAETYKANSGQYDDQGNRLQKNQESDGRFHTKWLNMMYPRLKIARDLLTDDGFIIISIDENEVNTLKTICDEIYGAVNFIAELVWSAGRKNDSKYISVSHEYMICYFKNAQFIRDNNIVWREKKQGLDAIYAEYEALKKKYGSNYELIETGLKEWYKSLPDGNPAKDHSHYNRVDEKGIYFADNISWPGGGGPKYTVLHPVTNKPVKIPSRGWITNEKTLKQWILENKVDFGKDEDNVPTLKSYLKDREFSVPYSVFYKDGRAASKRLATLMGDKVFENPKDEEVIQRIIQFSNTENGDIILDFFSGSATTAHSVFLADREQNKCRKFILVQLPEEIVAEKEASGKSKKVAQNATKLLDSIHCPHNICEIGKERIRRAGKKILEEQQSKKGDLFNEKHSELDVGFRVLKLDSSNMTDVYYHPEDLRQDELAGLISNIKEGRTDEDLLFQVMLDLGVVLSSSIEIETIGGKKVFNVSKGYLLACFDENVDEELITAVAKKTPTYFVMRDSSLANDSVSVNFDQIFEKYSPDTTRKVL